ncbi:MAG: hypothetical protein ACREMX_04560 [Gemmatimonadales bacterium]
MKNTAVIGSRRRTRVFYVGMAIAAAITVFLMISGTPAWMAFAAWLTR